MMDMLGFPVGASGERRPSVDGHKRALKEAAKRPMLIGANSNQIRLRGWELTDRAEDGPVENVITIHHYAYL